MEVAPALEVAPGAKAGQGSEKPGKGAAEEEPPAKVRPLSEILGEAKELAGRVKSLKEKGKNVKEAASALKETTAHLKASQLAEAERSLVRVRKLVASME
jgi:hypothetical protein